MRTFHTGGIFSSKVKQTILAPHEGIIKYNSELGGKKIITKYNENAYFTLYEKKIKLIKNKTKQSVIKIPPHTLILKKPNQKIQEKEIIAEIHKENIKLSGKKKFTKEIIEIKINMSGEINNNEKFINVLSGNLISKKELYKQLKKRIFSIKKLYIKNNSKYQNERISIKNLRNLNFLKNFKLKTYPIITKNAKYIFIPKKNTEKIIIFSKKNNKKIGAILKKGKTKEKMELINYTSQIIEKRINSVNIRKAKMYSNKRIIKKFNNSLIKINQTLLHINKKKLKTTDIVQGLPKIEQLLENKKTINLKKLINHPQEKINKYKEKLQSIYVNEIAIKKSLEKIQNYLIKEIQKVYKSQEVNISNKHLELIIKQMTSYAIIKEKGDSKLLIGDLMQINKIEKFNKKINQKILYEPIIVGISKLSLNNESFISEASFQETTKIIIKAALKGKIDWLYGLKENIVLSNLIPAGTSFNK